MSRKRSGIVLTDSGFSPGLFRIDLFSLIWENYPAKESCGAMGGQRDFQRVPGKDGGRVGVGRLNEFSRRICLLVRIGSVRLASFNEAKMKKMNQRSSWLDSS
ncbi:hypothetical protein CDAR_385721 [Caerostris darwini]|uniref:Uncharacterized protein n=1 Tax=Caerostris darwini TaxID=1538125 RepID=A0AAV4M4J8_9ARAC|nr:hypothetical protein CDAR_385721 [Caerostris darwini]